MTDPQIKETAASLGGPDTNIGRALLELVGKRARVTELEAFAKSVIAKNEDVTGMLEASNGLADVAKSAVTILAALTKETPDAD